MVAHLQSAQAKVLRRRLYVRTVATWLLFTLAFLACAMLFETFVVNDMADYVADHLSEWLTVPSDSIEKFWIEHQNTDYSDWQVIYSDSEGVYRVRNLSLYYVIRNLKVPVAVSIYLAGCIIIVLAELGRSLRYFDELSGAVAGLMADRSAPVRLSGDLAVTQGELNVIREAALSDERTAVEAERRKNELVAYLAHDIRTPLTSVVGYLSLLDEGEGLPEEARRKYTAIAYEKAERLEGLIDEFFEITRYNLQSIPIERAHVDVRLFCEQVAESFYPDAQARSVDIVVEAPEDEQFFVDADKLARACGNVMRNAVAYAEANTRVVFSACKDEQGAWTLSVSNQGREISKVHLQSIFEKFYREDAARGTSGGAGLGLAIAKEIVVAHGGTIEANSTNGTTVFVVRLP